MEALNSVQKSLVKIIVFNRLFSAGILISICAYLFQVNSSTNLITLGLLVFAVLLLLFHFLLMEFIGQIIRKKSIITNDICNWLAKVLAVSFAVVVTSSCLCTGNLYFASFYPIPIIIGSFLGDFGVKRIGIAASLFILIFHHTGLVGNTIFINNVVSYEPSSIIQALSIACTVILAGIILNRARKTSQKTNMLHSMATTDVLTGLINRRYFDRRLHEEVSRAKRHTTNLTLAMFDIDHFKQINDTYGHTIGDNILTELGEMILRNTRESDVSARYGGEEFSLILPETTQIEAYELLERLRHLVETHTFNKDDVPVSVTISVGISQFHTDQGPKELIEQSDAALYRAKRTGRNRVVYGAISTPKLNLQKVNN